MAVRNSLRGDPAKAAAYAALKRDLAERHAEDIDAYIAGKSAFLSDILAQSGMNASDLAEIARINSIEKLRAIQ